MSDNLGHFGTACIFGALCFIPTAFGQPDPSNAAKLMTALQNAVSKGDQAVILKVEEDVDRLLLTQPTAFDAFRATLSDLCTQAYRRSGTAAKTKTEMEDEKLRIAGGIKVESVEILAIVAPESAKPLLDQMRDSDNPFLRDFAAAQLHENAPVDLVIYGLTPDQTNELLVELQKSPDRAIRIRSAEAVGNIAAKISPRQVDAIALTIQESFHKEKDPAVKLALATTAAKFGAKNVKMRSFLEATAKAVDESSQVRQMCQMALDEGPK